MELIDGWTCTVLSDGTRMALAPSDENYGRSIVLRFLDGSIEIGGFATLPPTIVLWLTRQS